jgi:hypothetical protein
VGTFGTWNVRSVYTSDYFEKRMRTIIKTYTVDLVATQEDRWGNSGAE